MADRRIPDLLEAWREAERRWEDTRPDDPAYDDVRSDVLSAWMAYQQAVGSVDREEVVLVADNDMRYVAANEAAHRVLGYVDGEIVGRTVSDLTIRMERDRAVELWRDFRLAGRQDGEYVLLARNGSALPARYTARAHFPVADLHTSRLTVIAPGADSTRQDGSAAPRA